METFKRLHKLINRLKWRSPSDIAVKFCPKCGSQNVSLSSAFDMWLIPEQYVCKDCGYKGFAILEKEACNEPENANQASRGSTASSESCSDF